MSSQGPQGLQNPDLVHERTTSEISTSPLFQNMFRLPGNGMFREADLDSSLIQLDLPCHVLKRLYALGIKTVHELVQTLPEKLLSTPGFGCRSLHKVRAALKKYFGTIGNNGSSGKSSVEFDPLQEEIVNSRLVYLENLYATCLTYESVGRRLGIKRQRVQQLIKFGQSMGMIPKDILRKMAQLRKTQKRQREKQMALQFPREALLRDYAALGSIRRVAKKYGMNRYALSKLIKHYKLTLSRLKKSTETEGDQKNAMREIRRRF